MDLRRRRFLSLAASAATITIVQPMIRVRAQAAAILPKRPARDRLEQALTRIADPNGEGG
jgi:hypothetical protein